MPEVRSTAVRAKVNFKLEHMPLAELKQALDYNPTTGLFTWKIQRRNGGRPPDMSGSIAGHLNNQGYVHISFIDMYGQRHSLRAHKLAWLFQTGLIIKPPFEVDHIDGNRSNNRWINLRLVTHSQNQMNSVRRSDSTSNVRGVSFRTDINKWYAYININKKRINLGFFYSKNDAIVARQKAELKYFGEYRRS